MITSTGVLAQGLGAIAAGVAVAYVCWRLRKSEGYLTRTSEALVRSRLRAPGDRKELARGMRISAWFGVGVGALVVLIGVASLLAG